MEKEKNKIEEHLDSLMSNKIVRIGAIVTISIGGLYVLSKAFNAITKVTSSFKEMTDTFRR